MMRILILLLALTAPAWGAYTFAATATIPAASGSTQLNDTLVITGSDVKLKTLANGGQVRHTVTRQGITVPADLVLGTAAGCGTLYAFDVAAYDAVAGTVIIWLLMSSHLSSVSTTVHVCLGNAAVSTYQGGSVGAAYDTTALQVYHLGESANPFYDATAGGRNSTSGTYPSQVAGQIGKAQSFVAASHQFISVANNPGGNQMTYAAWVKTSSGGGGALVDGRGNGGGRGSVIYLDASVHGSVYRNNTGAISGSTNLADGNWHHIVGTMSSTVLTMYVDGAFVATGGSNPYFGESAGAMTFGVDGFGSVSSYLNGVMEEAESYLSEWTADRVATIYGNQLNPPVISAFTGGTSDMSVFLIIY